MKTRTKLLIYTLVPVSFLVISIAVQFRVEALVDQYQHRGLLLGQISKGLAGLDILILEQHFQSRERAHAQWLVKYRQLEAEMKSFSALAADEQERTLLERLKISFALLGNLDKEIDESIKRLDRSGTVSLETQSYINRMESRIRQELQVITPEIERLYENNNVWVDKLDQRRDIFNVLMLALMGVFAPVFAYLFYNAVVVPLGRLQEGIERITAGDLDFRIAITSNDEIAQVSSLFNEMLERRREAELTIRKMTNELEQRVEERTRQLEAMAEELRRSEQKYRIVSNNTQDWEFWLDPAEKFVYTSPSCRSVTGHTADEFYADTGLLTRIVHPDDREKFREHRHDVTNGETLVASMHFRIVRPDGAIRWIEHICQPIIGDSGEFLGNRGSNRDITERKHIENELKESRQQLANIIDFLPDAAFVIDNDKRVIAWNRAMEEMTGIPKEEMLGQGDHAYTVPFFGERRSQLLDLLDISDHELESRYQQVKRTGEILYAEIAAPALYGGKGGFLWASGAPLYSTDNKRVGAIEVIRDISERKKVEEELQQATRTAEAATRAKSEFLANMSHEIRTPMNAITGMAYLALQTDLDPRQREYVSRIRSSADSLLGIINDILDFSKIEAGKMELDSACFDLNELFCSVGDHIAGKAEDTNLEILFSKLPEIPELLIGDAFRLGQILNNIVSNAIKFTENGKIIVTVAPGNAAPHPGRIALTFSVTDTGIGMDQEHLERIFMPFTQADSSITRRFGGTGLGLSIVRRLLELMGSDLEVVSEPGVGSTFSFTVELGLPPGQIQQRVEIPEDLKEMRILVADASPDACKALESMLTMFSFRAASVESGAAALRELARAAMAPGETPYRLALLDWRMPGMDGLETVRHIRNDLTLSPSPEIIIISGYISSAIREEAEELGVQVVLAKPLQMSTLFNAIMETFGRECRHQIQDKSHTLPVNGSVKQLNGIRVLLAEDNNINQIVAQEILKRFGAEVVTANNGREAVEAVVGGGTFDMVFMDIQMPEMNGYEATTAIRRIKGDRELPIIAITALAYDEERERCLAAGMNDHVAKPFDPDQLYSVMLRWVRPGKAIGSSAPPKSAAPAGLFPDSLPGIDVASVLKRCGGNRALAKEIITSFRDQNRSGGADIRGAVGRGDRERAQFLIHTIKGLSGTIGATSLFDTISELETAMKDRNESECTILLENMERQLAEVLESADTLEKICVDLDGARMPLEAGELALFLKELHDSLRDNDLGAARIFERLKDQIRSPEREELNKQIAKLDFDKAMKTVERAAKTLGIELQRREHVSRQSENSDC
jgi:PAS domain S-box-containing protein